MYQRTNKGHIGLKYKTRKDKGILKQATCKCGQARHRGPNGRLYSQCLSCKNSSEKTWAEKNPERWAINQRKSRLKRTYGMTLEDFDQLLTIQRGLCAICPKKLIVWSWDPMKGTWGSPDMACIDHDHKTGFVRGILCSECNAALGLFHDNKETLAAAIEYLR